MGSKKKARQPYGGGSVSEERNRAGVQRRDSAGRPGWRICISIGKSSSGKREKLQLTFYGSHSEAVAYKEQLGERCKRIDPERFGTDFAALCAEWELSMRRAGSCCEKKLKTHVARLRLVKEHMPARPLADIKPEEIEDAIYETVEEQGYSQATKCELYALLKRVFAFARMKKMLAWDVFETITRPATPPKPNRRSLSIEECARINVEAYAYLKAADGDFWAKEVRMDGWRTARHAEASGRTKLRGLTRISEAVSVILFMRTGIRKSEGIRLEWRDVDLRAQELVVRKAKTACGVRRVSFDPATRALLAWWRQEQRRILSLIDYDFEAGEPPVLCDGAGRRLDPSHYSKWWEGFRKHIGADGLLVHELRHTQATQLIANGADLITVRDRIGHSRSTTTLDFYGHCLPARDHDAADLIGSIYDGTFQPRDPSGEQDSECPAECPVPWDFVLGAA